MTTSPDIGCRVLPNPAVDRNRPYEAPLTEILSRADFEAAAAEIRTWEGHRPTPLRSLHGLASSLSLGALWIKDESGRFGLGSFKALGGAYGVLRLVRRFSGDPAELTVACATDGNHGRAVAWGARRAGCRCVVYLHEGVSASRAHAIAELGARVVREGRTYDESVARVAADAAARGWSIVSDTSYPGYTETPREVMQGYGVLMDELKTQLPEPGTTHVFVQAGVGGLAAAVCVSLWEARGPDRPRLVLVEPERAACLFRSGEKGGRCRAEGDLRTIMAGLACGEVSLLAWEILSRGADAFMTISDSAVPDVMRLLAREGVVSGESGAAGLAGVMAASRDGEVRSRLGLTSESRVLTINTEGATDPELYASIVGE